MKYKLLFSILMFHSLGQAKLMTGPSTGGGGFVVECPATPVEEASVQLLDLYEGPALGFTMAEPTGDLRADYFAAADRTYTYQGVPDLAEERRSEIDTNVRDFFRSVKMVPASEEMPQAADLGPTPWIPSQCRLRQVAYFEDSTNTIYILKPLFDRLNSVGQAALVTHELFYRHLRGLNETTSHQTRLIVAHIYATSGAIPLMDGVVKGVSKSYSGFPVHSGGTASVGLSSLYITPMTGLQNISRLQFRDLFGRPILAKTWADIPRLPTNLKLVPVNNGQDLACVVLDAVSEDFEAPLQGTGTKNLKLKVSYSQGQPIELTLLSGATVLGRSYISGGKNCEGEAIR